MNLKELYEIQIDKPNADAYKSAKNIWDNISKPIDSLGDFEDLICKIAAIRNKVKPSVAKKAVVVMCADNGIVSRGISQSGQEITLAVAKVLGKGTSSVCNLAHFAGALVYPVDIGINSDEKPEGVIDMKVAHGTKDFLSEEAMTAREVLKAIASGIEIVRRLDEEGIDIIATGEMGIGNTTTSTALLCALTGINPDKLVGRGSGLDDAGLERKRQVIKEALGKYDFSTITDDRDKCFEMLRTYGGLDIAGMAGLFIGAAIYHIPIIIDGLISAVSALVAKELCKGVVDYMIPSHLGKEQGVGIALEELKLSYFINANMALGEGTGAVMMFPLIDMVHNFYMTAATFSDYEIDKYERYQ